MGGVQRIGSYGRCSITAAFRSKRRPCQDGMGAGRHATDALVWLGMTTGTRWVASRSIGPAQPCGGRTGGRPAVHLILETGEIHLILRGR